MTAERGLRFDGVAEEYDRVRLGYPAERPPRARRSRRRPSAW
jgi:hypothetical protein